MSNASRARFANFLPNGLTLHHEHNEYLPARIAQGGYDTSSEYLRELIRKDSDRLRLRGLLQEGAASAAAAPADSAYFIKLRKHAQRRAQG